MTSRTEIDELSKYISGYFDTTSDNAGEIAALFKEERLKRDQFHTRIGSHHGKLSFLKSGFIRIFKQTDKKEVTQWISSKGEFVTDLSSLMFDQPARWNIQALTDCELFTLDYSNYETIKEKIPNWPEIEKLFLAKCFITIEERVFSFLSMTAEERYEFLLQNRPDLLQQIPLQYIASMLGMTPETLSRVRKKIIS